MSIKVKYFILMVLINGLPYALFITIIPFEGSLNFNWTEFLFSFIFFGGFMGIMNYFLLKMELSDVGVKNLTSENIGQYLNPQFTVYKSVDEIIDILQKSDYKTSIEAGDENVVLVCPGGFLRDVKVSLIYKKPYETYCVLKTVNYKRETFLKQISDVRSLCRVTKLISGSYILLEA